MKEDALISIDKKTPLRQTNQELNTFFFGTKELGGWVEGGSGC